MLSTHSFPVTTLQNAGADHTAWGEEVITFTTEWIQSVVGSQNKHHSTNTK